MVKNISLDESEILIDSKAIACRIYSQGKKDSIKQNLIWLQHLKEGKISLDYLISIQQAILNELK